MARRVAAWIAIVLIALLPLRAFAVGEAAPMHDCEEMHATMQPAPDHAPLVSGVCCGVAAIPSMSFAWTSPMAIAQSRPVSRHWFALRVDPRALERPPRLSA